MKQPQNIWDLAIEQAKEKRANVVAKSDQQASSERSLVVLGNKGVGKTTLIHRFLDSQDSAKPTLALEYTFGRKTNNNLAKDVCHIWELGGATLFTKLLETPLSPLKLINLHVVIMVDLSKPGELWFTLETLMTALQNHLEISLKSQEALANQIEEKLKLKLEVFSPDLDGHPDKSALRPFLLPLIIIGSKYDEFQNLDPEKKKIICKALRFFALHYGASLQFYSAMDSGLVKKAKDLLNHYAFGAEPVKGVSQDYNKPLFIPPFSDSVQAIMGQSGNGITLDMWKHQYTTQFPQTVTEQSAMPSNPAKDANFKEDRIDKLRAQKDDELDRYRRTNDRNANRRWNSATPSDFDQSFGSNK